MDNIFNLTDKVIVVTGGGGLLGTGISKALAAHGATVIIAEINEILGKQLAFSLQQQNLKADSYQLDITSEVSIANFIIEIIGKYKKIDVWINNAYPRTDDWGTLFEDIKVSSWNANIEMHLGGYFLCCQKIAELMKKQQGGHIINMASIYGMVGPDFSIYEGTNMTMPAAYSVIKGAIVNFTKYLASYYGKFNVRVNAVSPGGIFDQQADTFVQNYVKKCPLKRLGNTEDIVGPIVFLASDASSYITGHNLVIDGGWTVI